eukprot:Sdes_comp18915_c0_seq1m9372
MQDPLQDTEWNDALRKYGIIPEKPQIELSEQELAEMIEETIFRKTQSKPLEDMKLEELDEFEDEEDDQVLEMYKRKRLLELTRLAKHEKFGKLVHISANEFIEQVNKAGENVWVVLHLYQESLVVSKLFNARLEALAQKFPACKFLKIKSTDCIPNYPDKNLPTLLIYFNGELQQQMVGAHLFDGLQTSQECLEWVLSKTGCISTEMEQDPREEKYRTQLKGDSFVY